ncbi:uncharacterized protein cubi_03499 [Cryptosporidium ubiquitum]|uniref:Uncharacterized protein n=1 Tax=Cryptosporidium ubiquitum TaxID=857276 RepID=A0A1J4MLF5_9CRYT|nr:uncharacterized protein cubi_03499 [Cryptosporidium ubiquitum]OII73701.1 hypothetical protein cubi_03499 [Cryptosporidium ubiquitum]
MNVIFELIKNGIRVFGIKIGSFSNDNFEELSSLIYDEYSGFHIVEGFNIAESESFLIVSKESFFQNYEVKSNSFNLSECNGEIKKDKGRTNLNQNNENLFKTPKFSDLKSTQTHEIGSAIACNTPTKTSCNADINIVEKEGFFINSLFEDTNESYFLKELIGLDREKCELTDYEESLFKIQDYSATPKFPDSKYTQKFKNDGIYLTSDSFDFYFDDKIRLNDDFKKSDLLLLLRLKRKKLAMLETQLKRNLKLLDFSDSSDTRSLFIDNFSSIEKIAKCPAQLYFIKRRIDNIKENIENTERDIAMLKENTSETY